jgi:hypothetical protein
VPSDCFTTVAQRGLGLIAGQASHDGKCPRCSEAPPESHGSGSSSTVSGTSISVERSTCTMLMDHIPRCPSFWYVIQLHDRIVHVLEEFILEAGATKGRDSRSDVPRIRSGASRDRPWDVVWLDFRAPHCHLVVDVTVTASARTISIVPHIGARLPLPGSLALGAQHGKLDADLRTSALLCMPSVQSVHDCYPFALEDGGRLAPMAGELVDRLALLVAVRRCHGMGVAGSRSMRFDSCVRTQHFARRSTSFSFSRFRGDVRREFMQRLFAALHGTLGSDLRDDLQEGGVNVVACLRVPRA